MAVQMVSFAGGRTEDESFVNWWCHLIGITDTMAIQVATGVMGGGLACLLP